MFQMGKMYLFRSPVQTKPMIDPEATTKGPPRGLAVGVFENMRVPALAGHSWSGVILY